MCVNVISFHCDYKGTVQIGMSSKFIYDLQRQAKFERCKMCDVADVLETRRGENYILENKSGFGSLICCMRYPSCTMSLNGPFFYLKQEDGKNSLHCLIIFNATC